MINNRQNGRRRGRGSPQVRGPGGNGSDRGNRIDNRARGNAAQLHEKYRNLARDAQTQGDRVMTEYYLQFADHYFRVLNESRARFEEQNPNQNQQRRPRFENDEFDDGGDEGDGGEELAEAEPRRDEREPRRYERQDRDPRQDREPRPDREPRQERESRQDREPRQEREPRQDREPRQEREPRQDREPRPDREPRQEREPRQDREPRRREPVAVEAEAPREEVSEDEAGDRRPRRGRRPRRAEGEGEAQPQRIEIDRLPPAFGSSDDAGANGQSATPVEADAGDESAPRRRRTRRVATPNEDSPVAA